LDWDGRPTTAQAHKGSVGHPTGWLSPFCRGEETQAACEARISEKVIFMGDRTTRDHIVEAADQLFYQRGYEYTSFSDIADVVQISRGNFYYHFKSKDEILDAVISLRLANTRRMLEQWENDGQHPADHIRSFIQMLIANRTKIMLYGCPVGTLCTELAKLNHASQAEANKLFTLFRTWLRRQFTLLGCEADADALAMHLLARSQGVATLANAFHDEKFIKQEVRQMYDWLSSCMKSTAHNAQ
jgi:TetR/AcrR family transcriptional regulator, transcriptional repressor for nem operon